MRQEEGKHVQAEWSSVQANSTADTERIASAISLERVGAEGKALYAGVRTRAAPSLCLGPYAANLQPPKLDASLFQGMNVHHSSSIAKNALGGEPNPTSRP